jgi:ABC-type microcin C transport system permease subunit YejE
MYFKGIIRINDSKKNSMFHFSLALLLLFTFCSEISEMSTYQKPYIAHTVKHKIMCIMNNNNNNNNNVYMNTAEGWNSLIKMLTCLKDQVNDVQKM